MYTLHDTHNPAMSTAAASDSDTDDTYNWEIQDILAVRKGSDGALKVLVMWKPTWIAVDQLDQTGPVYREWLAAPKSTKTIVIREEIDDKEYCSTSAAPQTIITHNQPEAGAKRGKQ